MGTHRIGVFRCRSPACARRGERPSPRRATRRACPGRRAGVILERAVAPAESRFRSLFTRDAPEAESRLQSLFTREPPEFGPAGTNPAQLLDVAANSHRGADTHDLVD